MYMKLNLKYQILSNTPMGNQKNHKEILKTVFSSPAFYGTIIRNYVSF